MKTFTLLALSAFLLSCGKITVPQDDAPEPVFHQTSYGKFVQVENVYYSSGLTGRQPDGTLPEGMADQTEKCLEKFQKAYAELGLSLADVIKVNVYIVDIELKPEMNRVYQQFFTSTPTPCRAAVAVASLDPGRLVEMEMIAVKRD